MSFKDVKISIDALTDEIHKQNNKDIHFINSIFLTNQNENESKSEIDWRFEWENGNQIRHSNVLFEAEDETKRNDWWIVKEKHGFNEVLLNQQILSNEELTILMIVKIVSMTIRRIWKI